MVLITPYATPPIKPAKASLVHESLFSLCAIYKLFLFLIKRNDFLFMAFYLWPFKKYINNQYLFKEI